MDVGDVMVVRGLRRARLDLVESEAHPQPLRLAIETQTRVMHFEILRTSSEGIETSMIAPESLHGELISRTADVASAIGTAVLAMAGMDMLLRPAETGSGQLVLSLGLA